MKIPLIKPFISDEIKEKVLEVLDSGYLTEGPVTREFESQLKSYLGCEYLLAVTSATTGLEMALRAVGVGPGDEIIAPDYTYPATAAVGPLLGAKVKIVDVDKRNMLIDYDAIEAVITPNTKAIVPVSLFGSPLDYNRLLQIKEKYNVYIIEDAACSIGAEYNKVKVGCQADISVFSLHPRKFITTGEGGVVTTNNKDWANWMNSYKHFGMDMSGTNREGIQFDIIGTNYKLTNIQAAIGLGQLKHIDELLAKRIELAENYKRLLKDVDGIEIPEQIDSGQHSYQTFSIFISNRNEIMKKMREKGIEVQIGTYSLHMHKAFHDNPMVEVCGDMNNSKWCFENVLALPLYNDLSIQEQESVVQELKSCM